MRRNGELVAAPGGQVAWAQRLRDAVYNAVKESDIQEVVRKPVIWHCSVCGRQAKTAGERDAVPRNWKRNDAGAALCRQCWQDRYMLRAVILPVSGPVDCDWPALGEALKTGWQRARRLANLAVQELLKSDVTRTAAMKKLPPMPKCYLYPLIREDPEWDGCKSSGQCVLRAVELKYRAMRYERIWLGRCRLPDTRYPMPYPVHNRDWVPRYPDNGERVPLVTLPLPGIGNVTLRLRGGREFRRQLASFAQLVDGRAVRGELTLYEQRVGGAHYNGTRGRDSGGARYPARVMCKMVAWLPRLPAGERVGEMLLTTMDDALLVAFNAKNDRIWALHADHVQRWQGEHMRRLQHWSDDSKLETRGKRRPFASRRDAASRKYAHRMNTVTQQIARQIMAYADRCHFARVSWKPSAAQPAPWFPWAALWERVGRIAAEMGIIFYRGDENGSESENEETSAE